MASVPLLTAKTRKGSAQAFEKLNQCFAATFRSIKLQLLWQSTKWRSPHEMKKTAIYDSRTAALLHMLPHIVPMATLVTFLVANIKTTFIGSISTDTLAPLQFAAKMVEILTQASIATVVLGLVRNQVLGGKGFPLGGLLAPFTTTDISSLWSLQLWGCLTSTNIDIALRSALHIFLPVAIVLAALVGPSTAVLMIPRPMNHLKYSRLAFYNKLEDVYPEKVDLIGGNLKAESAFNATSFQAQMSAGSNWRLPIVDQYGVRNAKFVASITNGNWDAVADVANSSFETLATVPTTMSLTSLVRAPGDYLWTVRALQPYVYTSCWSSLVQVSDTDPSGRYVDFGPAKPYLKNAVSYKPLLLPSNATMTDDLLSLYRTDYTCQGLRFCGSIMWAKLPPNITSHSLVMVTAQTAQPEDQWLLSSCTIDAYWSTVTTRLSASTVFSSDKPANPKEDPRKVLSELSGKRLVSISPAWAQRAYTVTMELERAAKYSDDGEYLIQGLQYAIALSYVASDQQNWAFSRFNSTEKWTSEMNGMNQQQYTAFMDYIDAHHFLRHFDEIDLFVNNTVWVKPEDLTKLETRRFAIGYGYDISAITTKLSLAVVMFYVAAISGYLLYTIATGTVAASWNSVAELVVLAINSQRPIGLLRNTSVGIDTLETFRQPVNIRVNHNDSVELVFDSTSQTRHYSKILPNEKY
ncbi:hypothetical protein EPUS_08203 [Endocarpon pusillum Z07020]|uniref:Uncharacterized protein n=1 Tax=Endocarpon pusillum (strain Z07020 / HMAS-L-300199) TaxID=1263415 RepID=U1FTR6_ENDPU|nr:uncharacterized protein EPUS_08203 [Endocarpon pusillum Z07020]ERF68137.1 hypothetical protein EPUS_08203 [Endocarpon pusillum Z07020]